MEISLLGPVAAWSAGQPLLLGPRQQRTVLAALAMTPGQPTTAAVLIDRVWGPEAPRSAQNALYSNLSRLRKTLARAGCSLERKDGGYLLSLAESCIDLFRARSLVESARALRAEPTVGVPDALERLREAYALWRGVPLADLHGDWAERVRHALTQERLAIATQRFQLELEAGNHTEIVPALSEVHAEHPAAEGLAAQLIQALLRLGDHAEALRVYARVRQRIVDELGVEPGAELRELHRQLLRGEVPPGVPLSRGDAQSRSRPAARPPSAAGYRPSQLPPAVSGFTGRNRELGRLNSLLASDARVLIVDGMAGVGKTALAVHWANHVRDQFSDGQLYLDLRAYSDERTMSPLEALEIALRTLVPAAKVPTNVPEAAALYRSVTAEKRMLVLLDNAAESEQVRPLLPGGKCVMLVTSRDQLTGLVARDGAIRLSLDVLSNKEAFALLARVLGARRVQAEQKAAATLINLCGRLPLALRIVSANLDSRPQQRIGDQAERLAGENRLELLATPEDPRHAVRPAFDLSYTRLAPDAQRALRLLGLVPGREVTPETAACLLDSTTARAESLLQTLTRAHLMEERSPGRYGFHDLVRRYAVDRAAHDETDEGRTAALLRLYDLYLRRVDAAARLIYPSVVRLPAAASQPVDATFREIDEARRWLDAELDSLAAAIRDGVADLARPAALLADGLRGYLWLRSAGQWPDIARRGLEAAEECEDKAAQASGHLSLAGACWRRGRAKESFEHSHRAFTLAVEAEWKAGEAAATSLLGMLHQRAGKLDLAVTFLTKTVALLGESSPHAASPIHTSLAQACARAGRLATAASHGERGLLLARESGARFDQAGALVALGEIYTLSGRLDDAVACLTEARRLFRDVGSLNGEAMSLGTLAVAHREAGRIIPARECVLQAQTIARDADDAVAAASSAIVLGTLSLRSAQPEASLEQCRDGLELARRAGARYEEAEALLGLAAAHRNLGDLDTSQECARGAIDIAQPAGLWIIQGEALLEMAYGHLERRAHRRAADLARQALTIHHRSGHKLGEARARDVLGQLHDRQRRRPTALTVDAPCAHGHRSAR